MIKKGFLAVFLIIFSASLCITVSAADVNFSVQKSFDWMAAQGKNGNYGSVFSAAIASLAFNKVGYDEQAAKAIDWILEKKDNNGCFPAGGCTIKDTALALKAISEIRPSEDVSDITSWLKSAKSSYVGLGKWGLFITTSNNGTCELSYPLGGELKKIPVDISAGSFPSCQNSKFLDIDKCVKPNLLGNNPGISITVDCSALSGTTFITLAYKKGNEWFIQNTWDQNVVDVTVNNVCYGKTAKQTCTKEDSGYADWASLSLGEQAVSTFYLKSNYVPSEIFDNVFLYFNTKNTIYLENLKKYQKSDGSFDENTEKTAYALMVLREGGETELASKAKSWLEKSASEDGSWSNSFAKTAISLLAAFSDAYIGASTTGYEAECQSDDDCFSDQSCIDGFCVDKEQPKVECEYDTECDTGLICSNNKCIPEKVGCESDDECGFEEVCIEGECKISTEKKKPIEEPGCKSNKDCSQGEICQDNKCVPKPKKSMSWLVILLIIILAGGLGYFVFTKISKSKGIGKKPPGEYRPFSSRLNQKPAGKIGVAPKIIRRPILPIQRQIRKSARKNSKLESELSKSLNEAKKLLKK